MEAIRRIVHREGNTLTVELPDSFTAQTVELIILPADDVVENLPKEQPANDVDKEGLTDFQRFLLTAPDMSDEAYNDYLLKSKASANGGNDLRRHVYFDRPPPN